MYFWLKLVAAWFQRSFSPAKKMTQNLKLFQLDLIINNMKKTYNYTYFNIRRNQDKADG